MLKLLGRFSQLATLPCGPRQSSCSNLRLQPQRGTVSLTSELFDSSSQLFSVPLPWLMRLPHRVPGSSLLVRAMRFTPGPHASRYPRASSHSSPGPTLP